LINLVRSAILFVVSSTAKRKADLYSLLLIQVLQNLLHFLHDSILEAVPGKNK